MAGLYSKQMHSSYSGAQHLVLLHGWGISSQVWQPCVDILSRHYHLTFIDLPGFGGSESSHLYKNSNLLLEALAEQLPERCSLLGFSLGGMLAIKMAERYPERIERVITVASNAVFVQTNDWPEAMAASDYKAFYDGLNQSPSVVAKRFLSLQAKGADDEKGLLKTLRALADKQQADTECLLSALNVLSQLDNRETISALGSNVTCIFGENDQLVPVATAEGIQQLGARVERMKGASHTPFVSHPHHFCRLIDKLMGLDSAQRNKMAVANSFSKAAASYDDVAELQRNVGKELLNHLPRNLEPQLVVDLGCGTGYFLPPLAELTQTDQIAALDLAEGMLNYARQHRNGRDYWWLCGDAESIPLADNSVDIIFSSLAIQWCESNESLFAEINRVLKPGGQFVFSTLGPGTLKELRQAWLAVDDYVHVNHFDAEQDLQHAVAQSGLIVKQWHEQSICLQYDKLTELTRELKSLGAHNVNAGRPEGLMGKQRIKAFKAAYEALRNEAGLLPATYQVWYGVVEKQVIANG